MRVLNVWSENQTTEGSIIIWWDLHPSCTVEFTASILATSHRQSLLTHNTIEIRVNIFLQHLFYLQISWFWLTLGMFNFQQLLPQGEKICFYTHIKVLFWQSEKTSKPSKFSENPSIKKKSHWIQKWKKHLSNQFPYAMPNQKVRGGTCLSKFRNFYTLR